MEASLRLAMWHRAAFAAARTRVRTSAILVLACLTLVASLRFVALGQARPPDPVVLDEFNVARGGNFLTLPVTMNDKVYPFLIDTGCTFCSFDGALRALLGPKTRTEVALVAGGATQFDFYSAPAFRLGRLDFRPKEAMHVDLREYMMFKGNDVYGIVGFTCLLDKVISIDFDAGKVRFLDRVPTNAGHRVPLEWSMKGKLLDGPYAVASVAGAGDCRFFVDTGYLSFDTGELEKSLLDRLQASRRVEYIGPATSAWGLAGMAPKRTARLRQLSIGPFSHREVLVSDSSLHNKLGLRYLSRYVVTFDFPNKA
ncbi:MAG: retropepsin-like aspartic protease, partial [Candidatus Saccharimonadales bacterium]